VSKIAFFDFCETLVSFQTADAYVDYIRINISNPYMQFLDIMLRFLYRLKIIAVLNKLFPGNSWYKRMKLYQLRNLSKQFIERQAESYYREKIKPELIQPVVEEMKTLAENGYEICLVSAAYSIYLRHFAEEYNIRHVLATEILFGTEGKRCLGRIKGTDCYGDEKVRKIMRHFKDGLSGIDESVSYSDSISDLPMLRFTNLAVVVSREKSQTWCSENNYREIIWR